MLGIDLDDRMSDKKLERGLESVAAFMNSPDFNDHWENLFSIEDEIKSLVKVFKGGFVNG